MSSPVRSRCAAFWAASAPFSTSMRSTNIAPIRLRNTRAKNFFTGSRFQQRHVARACTRRADRPLVGLGLGTRLCRWARRTRIDASLLHSRHIAVVATQSSSRREHSNRRTFRCRLVRCFCLTALCLDARPIAFGFEFRRGDSTRSCDSACYSCGATSETKYCVVSGGEHALCRRIGRNFCRWGHLRCRRLQDDAGRGDKFRNRTQHRGGLGCFRLRMG